MPGPSFSRTSSDVIVIGAGPNGLACAHRLASKGRKVTLIEADAEPGGGIRALPDLAPGLTPSLAHLVWQLDPRVEAAMDLTRHGLSWEATDIPTTVIGREGNLVIRGALTDGPDAAAWKALHQRLMSFAAALEPFRRMAPPRLQAGGNSWGRLAKNLIGIRALGTKDFRELLRVILINAHDVAQDELSDPRLRAALCFDAVLGAWAGPRSPNTLILLLDRLAGEITGRKGALGLPKGGMPALAQAMTNAATAAGVSLRSNSRVSRITVADDRVTGVALASGETLVAPVVISAIGPKATILSLAGPEHFDTGLVTALRHQKSRGGTAKLHLALSARPDFQGADLRSRLLLAADEHEVETAFNPVKYGEVPDRPVMEIVIPTAFSGGTGPHLLSANVQFAPHAPRAGEDAAREAMLKACLARLEEASPGISALITRAGILMPYDIERQFGMAGGNWHHGELAVEQMLFNRPIAPLSRYATPLKGLWLTGAGTHPGGMSGAVGWNAADAVLEART
ncbi:NAD(P)/FAD-dependent oxidoreductase [Rhodobacter sp. 24-YEA-8]|uniref:phytoene desaturase family protein n=1 Tax=Rhodobacter sp. 24-YEA-8 TaxID=1884310 RepID=UPI000894BFDA|nr:NAD(P)/FAD-dependent oxidoreductase [Rhodobacter sp. 24-YEA-8]SEC55992.1 Phytoene dehydrogenase-related protein [Rhodobacter sp. 24-YEA-8]